MYQRSNGTWCDTLPNGKGKTKFFYGKTKAEVKKKMNEWQSDKEKGKQFKVVADEWLDKHRNEVKETTFAGYLTTVGRIQKEFGELLCSEITTQMLQKRIKHLQELKYSSSYIEKDLSAIKLILDFYIYQPDCPFQLNPANGVKFKRDRTNIRKLPTEAQIQTVINAVNDPFGLFAYLILYTGLRKGEALALTDADFHDGFIYINKAIIFKGNFPYISLPKTEAGKRKVKIFSPLQKVLPKWKGYLFSIDGGKTPLKSSEFTTLWTHYCNDNGLSYSQLGSTKKEKFLLCPHQLRHAFATLCFEAGLDSKDTMELLGHANERTTKDIYTHISENRRKTTYDRIESYLEKAY